MTAERIPRVLSIPAGAPFLPTLADAVLAGTLVPEFAWDGAPLTLADTTIFVPTRRAARELRSVFAERLGGRSAILPAIRPLGEFDEDDVAFEADGSGIDLAQPIAPLERLLALAPLVHAWKSRLPAHVAALFEEDVTIPASAADAIWLARDLAALIDEIETEDADWKKLGELASGNLAGWWQVTLDFLEIVTSHWPEALRERGRSNPAAHRNALIRMEAARLSRTPAVGPVIAAGSTGSIPATAELLAVISRLRNGAVVLPGLDLALDERSWSVIATAAPASFGVRAPAIRLGKAAAQDRPEPCRCHRDRRARPRRWRVRSAILADALRPARDHRRLERRSQRLHGRYVRGSPCRRRRLIEAANERDEALTIATALRGAVVEPKATAALVTSDRDLARRVSAELLRFGIRADDSGGTPLARTPPGEFLALLLEAVFRPGNPVPIAALLKHPFLRLGMERSKVRHATETIELVALRGGTGRPDIADAGAAVRGAATPAFPRPTASRNGSGGSARQISTKHASSWPGLPMPSRRSPPAAAGRRCRSPILRGSPSWRWRRLARDETGWPDRAL